MWPAANICPAGPVLFAEPYFGLLGSHALERVAAQLHRRHVAAPIAEQSMQHIAGTSHNPLLVWMFPAPPPLVAQSEDIADCGLARPPAAPRRTATGTPPSGSMFAALASPHVPVLGLSA